MTQLTPQPTISASTPPAGARRDRSRGGARRLRLAGVAALASAISMALPFLVPGVALAHPLGNFTINHFAAVRVAPDHVDLDVVIDRAEIPAFQERQRIDADGDGTLQSAELQGQPAAACTALASNLDLTVAGARVATELRAAGLSFPPGAGDLVTMRLVCEYSAALAAPIAASTPIGFADHSFSERIGWREIVVAGDGTTVSGTVQAAGPQVGGVSNRLTTYPTDLLTQPLDQRSIAVSAVAGGAALARWAAPDATPIEGSGMGGGDPDASAPGTRGAVPGGVGQELAALVDVQDLTPLAIAVSLAIAFVLGVVHAVSPGHGKTIMAAYLVGARGSSRQAVGLGLAVTVSHTLGVLVLAGITLAASSFLPPERLYPILGVASGGLVILIGGSLLWQRLRAMLAAGAHRRAHEHGHEHGHQHGHGHGHGHGHEHEHSHAGGHGHPHDHGRSHEGEDTISWRGLLALGLSGGLVPSASALILLLGSIAAGRVAYGLVLVVGFGLGMAVVLTGIGLLLVHARRFVEGQIAGGASPVERFRRLVVPVQLATAGLVVALGVVLTGQALTQVL
jgi:nickel/cobalt transporter (NicO) family protein